MLVIVCMRKMLDACFLPVSSATIMPGNVAGLSLRLMGSVQPGGGLAQLGEHDVRNVGVAGSTPVPSTTVVDHAEIPQ